MVRQLIGVSPGPALGGQLTAAGGNPLYLRELIDAVRSLTAETAPGSACPGRLSASRTSNVARRRATDPAAFYPGPFAHARTSAIGGILGRVSKGRRLRSFTGLLYSGNPEVIVSRSDAAMSSAYPRVLFRGFSGRDNGLYSWDLPPSAAGPHTVAATIRARRLAKACSPGSDDARRNTASPYRGSSDIIH